MITNLYGVANIFFYMTLSENTPLSFALLTSLGVLRAATLLPMSTKYLEYNINSIVNDGQVSE